MAAGMFYFLAPRMWKTKLYSVSLANMHFWLGTVGILLYVASMWVSGITQGLMLNNVDGEGILAYPNFLETLQSIRPLMATRIVGGGLYLVGFIMMGYNIWKTIQSGEAVNGAFEAPEEDEKGKELGLGGTLGRPAFLYSAAIVAFSCLWLFDEGIGGMIGMIALIGTCLLAIVHFQKSGQEFADWYDRLIQNSMPFTILVILAAAVGGIAQIVPLVTVDRDTVVEDKMQRVYTPLELAGRDLYIKEGCYNCHSQMIRPFVAEVKRYGDYSRLGESVYDHPYQWGSRRTGPDLARIGGKYPNIWHYKHMEDPRLTSVDSNMPNYPWMLERETDYDSLPSKIAVQKTLGVPFPDATSEEIIAQAKAQAEEIAADLRQNQVQVSADKEIIAMIAYLQQLGKSDDFPAQLAKGAN